MIVNFAQYQDTTFIFKIIQDDVVYIVSFIVSRCGILLYYAILYIRISSFRTAVAKKILRRLKTETFSTESLLIIEIEYCNIKILEYLLLIFTASTVNALLPIIINFSVIRINDITALPKKIIRTRLFSYTSVTCIVIIFSILKKTFVLTVEIVFNFFLMQLSKATHTFCLCQMFLDKIHEIKRTLVDFLKSVGFYRFFSWFIRFQFYRVGAKYFGLRYTLRLV